MMTRTSLFTFAVLGLALVGCNGKDDDVEGKTPDDPEVAGFTEVHNASNARTRFVHDEQEKGDFNDVEREDFSDNGFFVRCPDGGTASLTIESEDDILQITGSADADCVVVIERNDVTAVTSTNGADIVCDGSWNGLAYLEVNGDAVVDIPELKNVDGMLAIEAAGNADIEIGKIDVGHVDTDLGGTSQTILHGAANSAFFKVSGDAGLFARDLTVEEVTLDVTGNAEVRVTATESVDGSVDGNASVGVWGGAEVLGDLDLGIVIVHD